MKIEAIVSEVQRDVVEIQQILKDREDENGQNEPVSNTSSLRNHNNLRLGSEHVSR